MNYIRVGGLRMIGKRTNGRVTENDLFSDRLPISRLAFFFIPVCFGLSSFVGVQSYVMLDLNLYPEYLSSSMSKNMDSGQLYAGMTLASVEFL
jgi:hypothetical protein